MAAALFLFNMELRAELWGGRTLGLSMDGGWASPRSLCVPLRPLRLITFFTAEVKEERRGFHGDTAAVSGGSDRGGCLVFIQYRIKSVTAGKPAAMRSRIRPSFAVLCAPCG